MGITVRQFGEKRYHIPPKLTRPHTTMPGREARALECCWLAIRYWATGARTLWTGQDWAFFSLYGAWARMSETLAPNIT